MTADIVMIAAGLIEICSITVALAAGVTCCFTKDQEERAFSAKLGIVAAGILIVTIKVAHVVIFGGK